MLLLMLSLMAAAMAIWSFNAAAINIREISLAYQVHGHILSLKSHTYQLFKQYGDAMTIGDLDQGRGEADLIAAIQNDIREARAAIGLEMETQGADAELEELESLAEVELMINRLISDLDRLSEAASSEGVQEIWQDLSRVLDSDIDQGFHQQISAMLAEEDREVQETLEEAEERSRLYRSLAVAFAALSIVLTIASIWTILRRVGHPVASLLSGIRAFSEGDRAHQIQEAGSGEIRDVIRTFNMMASQISKQTQALQTQNLALEETVETRARQLEQLVSDLKQSEENRRSMLADVSHELRTPLAIIQGEAEVALRGPPKTIDVYAEALRRTCDAARHTSRLVDDLLFIARNETGQVRLRITDLDLSTVVQETVATFGMDTALLLDMASAPMRGDADRIRQALLILLENARHHGGDEVALRLSPTPDGYRLAVEDNGPGMSNKEKKQAFVRFFRGSNAAERYRNGLGLGLPVALSIAEAHGGTIQLSDRPGGGLIAALILPVRPSLKVVA